MRPPVQPPAMNRPVWKKRWKDYVWGFKRECFDDARILIDHLLTTSFSDNNYYHEDTEGIQGQLAGMGIDFKTRWNGHERVLDVSEILFGLKNFAIREREA